MARASAEPNASAAEAVESRFQMRRSIRGGDLRICDG